MAKPASIKQGISGNHVSRVGNACLKVFTNRADANREWTVLAALHESGVSCVPTPIERRDETSFLMSWCDGEPLGNVALSDDQVDAFARALQEFGSAQHVELPPATNQPRRLVLRAHEMRVEMQSLDPHLQTLIDTFLDSDAIQELENDNTTWMGRGDPNLANAIWNGETITFVDFEHSGFNDRACELADFAEHLQSHANGDHVWSRLWDRLGLDDQERRRIVTARKLTAIWWLGMLMTNDLAKKLNPPERVFTQADRVSRLLDTV